MNLGQGIFACKLLEMEKQYGRLQSHLRVCQQGNREKIRSEIRELEAQCAETDMLLQQFAEGSRSPCIAELSEAQLSFQQKAEAALEHAIGGAGNAETAAELTTLYAEYALDFATQSVNHAMLAALHAIDLQMDNDEKRRMNDE